MFLSMFNPVALRKTKIVCNFGLSECNRVKFRMVSCMDQINSRLNFGCDCLQVWCSMETLEMETLCVLKSIICPKRYHFNPVKCPGGIVT